MTISREEIEKIQRAYYFAKNTSHHIEIRTTEKILKDCQATKFIYYQMVFKMIYDKFEGEYVKNKITSLISWFEEKEVFFQELIGEINDVDYNFLKNIIVDENIKRYKKNNFLRSIRKANKNEELLKEDIIEIFCFINQVRNNFFHGTKKAQEALKAGQEERFYIYSRILSNLIKAFIKIEGIDLSEEDLEDSLRENLGFLRR